MKELSWSPLAIAKDVKGPLIALAVLVLLAVVVGHFVDQKQT